MRISKVVKRLGVSPHYLRLLEWEGRIPQARTDFNGCIYPEFDVVLLRAFGVGTRPRKLKRIEEVLGAGS